MKWLKYLGMLLVVVTIVFVILANRDMTRIYGGLTERVDRSSFSSVEGPITFTNVNVLSPDGERFVPNQSVRVNEGLIVSIQNSATLSSSEQITGTHIDATGKYLIPGLTDTHVHLWKSPNDLLLYVANGVTQIRELIGEEDHLQWRKDIQRGHLGPDMFIASPRIGSFGGVEGFFMEWSQGFMNINGADEADKEVRKLHRQGYDAVKIYSHISRETYFAVVKTAKELNMRIIGHVPFALGLDDVYTDQESIAHLEELMNALNREFGGFKSATAEDFLTFVRKRSDDVAQKLRDNDMAVSTTLWLVESFVKQKFDLDGVLSSVELEYENPGISEWTPRVPEGGLGWLPGVNRYARSGYLTQEEAEARRTFWVTYAEACRIILRSLVKEGVMIMTGTDANLPPTVPGFSLHDEFTSLVKAGMSTSEVLNAATAQPANWLNNNAGYLEPGKRANMVLLEANPLEDIGNTRAIDSVVLNGKLLERKVLDAMLLAVKGANDSSRQQDIGRFVK
ncbi:MAG: amidohydrolase family protein [Gammaproteobacteria bacterium]